MDVDFFVFPCGPQLSHLIHVSVCVCVSGGAYSCMHLCVASWQNVGHGGSAAAWHALTWKWPKSHSLWYHSVCVHPLSLSLSPPVSLPECLLVPLYLFCVPFSYWLSKCLCIPLSLFPVFSISRLSTVFLFTLQFCFLRHHCFLFTISFLSFAC